MEIPLFLAMTAAEYQAADTLPAHPAWMACHFSSYGTGISNVPKALPPGAMLMLNDRTPICGHNPDLVAKTLCDAARRLRCSSILLDFQREGCEGLPAVIRAVLDRASCSVGVSALYAQEFDCPVLVPPIPPYAIPRESLAPWTGRELWLELSNEGTEITVTEEGSQYTLLPDYVPSEEMHREDDLHCHYKITVEDERILFHLGRTARDQDTLLWAVSAFGVTRTLGLWQETNS